MSKPAHVLSQLIHNPELVDPIAKEYAEIEDIISKCSSMFQKLYNTKEKVLLDDLSVGLDSVKKQLEVYEKVTNKKYIDQKCEQKKSELQVERFNILTDYLKYTSSLLKKKEQFKVSVESLKQINLEMNNIQTLLDFIEKQNRQMEFKIEGLKKNNSHTHFLTQPLIYVSPYSKQRLSPLRKSQTPRQRVQLPILSEKLHQLFVQIKNGDKGHTQEDIFYSFLELPQMKNLLYRAYCAK